MLDEVYAQIRIKRHEHALEPLRQWLAKASDEYLTADVHAIVDRVSQWRDAGALSLIAETVVAELTKQNRLDLAQEAQRYELHFRSFGADKTHVGREPIVRQP